jgi:hypothetical protein
MTGSLRGVECAGQAVAFGIKSSNTTDWLSVGFNIGFSKSYKLSIRISCSLCSVVVSIPFAWLTIRKIGVSSFEKISFAALDSGKADSITGSVDEKDEV